MYPTGKRLYCVRAYLSCRTGGWTRWNFLLRTVVSWSINRCFAREGIVWSNKFEKHGSKQRDKGFTTRPLEAFKMLTCIVSSKEVSASGGHSNTSLQKEGSFIMNLQPERKRIKKNSLASTYTQTIYSPPWRNVVLQNIHTMFLFSLSIYFMILPQLETSQPCSWPLHFTPSSPCQANFLRWSLFSLKSFP